MDPARSTSSTSSSSRWQRRTTHRSNPPASDMSLTSFALSDANGDSVSLGAPRQYIANGTAVPLVILRAPPIHFDQFGNKTYDVNNCYGANLGSCGFTSSYADTKEVTFSTDVMQTDSWEVSSTVTGGFSGFGADISASLEGHYGANFSNDNQNSTDSTVTVQVTARVDDYAFFRKTDYVVMEYPVYGAGAAPGQPFAYVAVVTGVDTSYEFETTGPGSTVAPTLDSLHQTGNLLSYPYYLPAGQGEPTRSIDDNPEISTPNHDTPGSATSTPFPAIGIGVNGSASGQDKFSSLSGQTVSNTHSDGYSVSADAGYSAEGVGITAKVEGSYKYDQSNFQSEASTFGKTMEIDWTTANLNKDITGTSYSVRPYLYWSRVGALVLDWEVQLPTQNNGVPTFWEQMYGHYPDPAFNLPDLLDRAKGYATPAGGLAFHTPDFQNYPPAPSPGIQNYPSFTIHNYSLKDDKTWPDVRFYLGNPATGGYLLGISPPGCVSQTACIPAMGSGFAYIQWTPPAGLGGHDVPDLRLHRRG